MKKPIISILIAVFLMFTLVGCGEANNDLDADTGGGGNTEIVDGSGGNTDNVDDNTETGGSGNTDNDDDDTETGGSGNTDNDDDDTESGDRSNTDNDDDNTETGGNGNSGNDDDGSEDDEDVAQGYTVTFICDDYVTVYVYETQDMSGDGEETNVAYSRNSDTGDLLNDGNGQVNFKLVFTDGYELEKLAVTEGNFNNLKGSADTNVENGYRITKIASDLTVTVTSQEVGTKEDLSQGYKVTFVCDEHVSVLVYKTQDMTAGGEATNIAYSRDSGTGVLLKDGEGQVNFVIVVDDGYEASIVITPGKNEGYKNLKEPNETEVDNGYRITKITADLTVTITSQPKSTEEEETNEPYSEYEKAQQLGVTITYDSGAKNCFTVDGNVITFNEISVESIYNISGELVGQIVIDVGDDYKFELSLQGLTLTNDTECPLLILSGDKVTISAKNGTKNYINDNREAISEDSDAYNSAIYSAVDLNLQGKGSLTVKSENNKGIHTKDDLTVKNLTLEVDCKDNALKGNDGVTIESGTLVLIARQGDCIKTSNSSISNKGNQKGTVTISGGTITLYAACDGIDAAYDVKISGDVNLQIYTDKYSTYSEEVTAVSESVIYVRYSSTTYKYSLKFYNDENNAVWQNSSTYTRVGNYYYYSITKPSGYSYVQLYIYSNSQTQGSDATYTARSSGMTVNNNYDTIALSRMSGSSVTCSWTNYTTSNQGGFGPGGMGGMNDGNTDKGDYSTKGIKADNEIVISGGTITIEAYDDAIHANNDVQLENNSNPLGNITISGGTLTLSSNDDAIHADSKVLIEGGSIIIKSSYEGIEGNSVEIKNGNISVKSSDDGINGTATTGTSITISGGNLYVYAGGDGVDSNSKTSYSGIVFSGGKSVIISTGSSDSSIDTEAGYKYEGGIVIGICRSGGMSSESKKCSPSTAVKSQTLTLQNYLVVDGVATVKMPVTFSALVVCLGTNSANITTNSSASCELDANGVYWNAN